MFLILIVIIVALGIGYILRKQREYKRFERRGIPGPKSTFPYGNAKGWLFKTRNLIYDIDDAYRDFKKKAPFSSFFAVSTPYLLLTDPELIKKVITKDFKKFRNNDFVADEKKDPLVSRNPFWLKDEPWKEKRIDFSPAMTPIKLKSIYPLINNSTNNLINYLKKKTGDLDARDVFSRFTCDSVISCIYGLDAQSFLSESPFMYRRGQEFIDGIAKASRPFFSGQIMSNRVQEFFLNIAKDAMKIREESKVARDDFLSHILTIRNKRGMSDLEVAADCATIFLDGYETTALTLHYTFYELGKNLKSQEKLRKEIKENLDETGKLTFEKLHELEYLDQVFNETMRLYSPVLYSTKICSEEIYLPGVKGHPISIKPGDTFWIPFFSIHRDPEYYVDPEDFIPERFDSENGGVKAFKDRCVLLPFGDGPRICVGTKFANVQVKAAIAEVIAKFTVSVCKQTPQRLIIGADKFLSTPDCPLILNFKLIQ